MIETATVNPFLFLQPYDLKGKYVLKGRTDEGKALLALLHWKDIIVVYGKSGVGKTSFINYTLSDKINRVSWLPVRITRLRDINKSFRDRLSQAMKAETIDQIHENVLPEPESAPAGKMNSNEEEKEKIAHETVELVGELFHYWNRPVYIIIDQLEELFLIGNKPEQEIFLETLRQLVRAKNIEKKIILVLRKEHLAYVQEIERILGGVFQDSLSIHEIKASEGEEILTSLLSPCDESTETVPEDLVEFSQKVASFKAQIVDSCTDKDKDKLSVQQLQVLLFILWEKLMVTGEGATPDKIADVINKVTDSTDPLRDYVNETVNKELGKNARLLKARYWFILTHSISAENTKKPVSLSELFDYLVEDLRKNEDKDPVFYLSRTGRRGQKAASKVTRQLDFEVDKDAVREWCEQLTEKRLLEKLPGEEPDGECYFQLTHDTLAFAIQQPNTNILTTKQQEAGLQLRFPRKFRVSTIDDNPYQGLQQYEFAVNDSGNNYVRFGHVKKNKLYGRKAIIEEYTNFLLQEEHTCLVIVGDSGTGKSSLVNGGILPALEERGYITETRQPGPDLENFKQEIETFIELNSHPAVISKTCLYIDQFEECYTYRKLTMEEGERFNKFLDFLSNAIKKCGANFKLIVSIRHDYAHEFDKKLTDWRGFKKLLPYPNVDEVFDIIVGPAYDKGLHFEPADLPEIIARDAVNTSYFLPLLSFTLQTLYQKVIGEHYGAIEEGAIPTLTLKDYRDVGEVVNCLQQQFTQRFNATENSHLFLQLLPRMIVIKDMIPKSRLLPEKDIDFTDPEKRAKCIRVLKDFGPDFIRKRDVVINGNTEECFEPLHDSLLTFCDEIWQMINPGREEAFSPFEMQRRLDLAMEEWLKANEEEKITVVKNHFRGLERLVEFVDKADKSDIWLFSQEQRFIDQCLDLRRSILDPEEQARLQKIRDLRREKENEKLRSEKLQADLELLTAEAQRKQKELESKKLQTELELVTAESQRKQQELESKQVQAELELQVEKAKGKNKKLYQWLTGLLTISVCALATAGLLTYMNRKAQIKMAEQNAVKNATDLINKKLQETVSGKNLVIARNDSIMSELSKSDSDNMRLIGDLNLLTGRQKSTIRQLEYTKHKLVASLQQVDSLNKDLVRSLVQRLQADSVNRLLEAELQVKYQAGAYNAMALRTIKASPTLSYRLAEVSKTMKVADNIVADSIQRNLRNESRYFESLIQDNIQFEQVSRDGSRVLAVRDDPNSDNVRVQIWHTDSLQNGKAFNVKGKFKTADISPDNQLILLANENSIRIQTGKTPDQVREFSLSNLIYAQFAEYDNRFFAITNDKVHIWSIDKGYQVSIPFINQGIINNARLTGDRLIIITPKGVTYADVNKSRSNTMARPQSFVINKGSRVISLETPIVENRKIVLFDSAIKKIWRVDVPDKKFNLITNFVSSVDGRSAIIQFNKKDDVFQLVQNWQPAQGEFFRKQTEQKLKLKKSPADQLDTLNVVNSDIFADNLFYLDLATGKMRPISFMKKYVDLGNFIFSATDNSIFEIGNGAINIYSITEKQDRYTLSKTGSISANARFQKLLLTGLQKELLLSHDVSGQMKLWRYGNANVMLDKKQIWKFSREELDKMAGIR